MAKESMKLAQEQLLAGMREWQKVENAAVTMTGRVMEKTENPIIRLVAEIIQRDSQMHHRVQEWIADSLDAKPVTLSPDDLGKVWDLIQEHIAIEKRTVEMATKALESVKGNKGMLVQSYLLNYLQTDETKHTRMLDDLEKIKGGMYPYG